MSSAWFATSGVDDVAEIFTSRVLVRCQRIGDVARWRRGLAWLMSRFFACGIFGCFWFILIDDDDDDDGDDYATVLVLLILFFGCPVSCLHHQFGLRKELGVLNQGLILDKMMTFQVKIVHAIHQPQNETSVGKILFRTRGTSCFLRVGCDAEFHSLQLQNSIRDVVVKQRPYRSIVKFRQSRLYTTEKT